MGGVQLIVQKLVSLPFQTVQHQISKCEGQPVPHSPGKVLVAVTGTMIADGNVAAPLKFAEFFHLCKKPTGEWFALNDIMAVGTTPMNPSNEDFQQIGQQFAQVYYRTFDTNPAGLTSLYADDSLLT